MPYKNTAVTVCFFAWDAVNGVPKTGDSANITLRGVGDGSEFTPSSPSITEVDSTNLPGVYSAALTAGENNYSAVLLGGKSSTSGISIQPVQWTNETSVQPRIKKNTALSNFEFMMTDSASHVPATGLTVTATRSIDGAAFASCSNSVSEISNGWYKINLSATDLNGDVIGFKFTATGADDRDFTVVTQP